MYIFRRSWIHRVTGALLAVAGISQMQKMQELAWAFCVFLLIPVAATVWILRTTGKTRKETASQ